MTLSPSIISVLRASTDNTDAPAAAMASIVDTPTTGTSKRISWFGLATFTIRTPPPASSPARATTASVPSMASTATTAPDLTAIVCPTSRPATASATRYPCSRSARSSSVGARRVSTPSRARSGARKAVESSRLMPCSRSTSAMPEMSASVLRALRRNSTPMSVRSGTMSANSFACFTCPAITASVTPASFSRVMHFPSWPSDTQWRAARGARAAASARSGSASSLMATTVTSCPTERAASSTRNGNRPLPAMRPRRTGESFVREHFLRPPRGAPEDDAALRRAYELDEILHFGTHERPIAFDLAERTGRIQLRLQQIAERALQPRDDVWREAAAHQANGVRTENPRRPAAHSLRKRQRILGHDGVAADERVAPDTAELMNRRARTDVREILDADVAAERRVRTEDRLVAHAAVVRDVHVG